jgi:hypothetical protein
MALVTLPHTNRLDNEQQSQAIIALETMLSGTATQTTDPTVASDNTLGFQPGSHWFNTTNSREWVCVSNATGAAVWALGGVVPGTGWEPANMLTTFGGSVFNAANGSFTEEGNLFRQVGNPIAGNAADTSDDILSGIVLPAGAFDVAGRGLNITAQGKTGATANAGKRFKLWLNPTMAGQTVTAGVISGGTVSGVGTGVLLLDSGTTAINAKGWSLNNNIFKIGAAAANTQYSQGSIILDTIHGGITAPLFPTQTESAVMNIVVTGSSAQSGASDIVLNFFEVNAMN